MERKGGGSMGRLIKYRWQYLMILSAVALLFFLTTSRCWYSDRVPGLSNRFVDVEQPLGRMGELLVRVRAALLLVDHRGLHSAVVPDDGRRAGQRSDRPSGRRTDLLPRLAGMD